MLWLLSIAFADEPSAEVKQLVKAEVVRHSPFILACYVETLESAPFAQGTISIGWTVKKGRAKKVKVVDNQTGSPWLGGCLKKRLKKKLRFPESLETDVVWPFAFKQ